MKKFVCIFCSMIMLLLMLSGCASASRSFKNIGSDLSGGLNRTVTVYDYNGEEIRSWTGKIDVDNSNDRTVFDLDGKRTIIRGGIVVIQEN